jgi:tryptophan-rich sensory protein
MMELLSGRTGEIAVAALAVIAVAVAGGLMTEVGDWYESLKFPRLRPPNWLFAPAWTVIFAFIAASGVVGWEHADSTEARTRLIGLFAVNAILNVLWSPLFFKLRRPDLALYELAVFWLSILALVIELSRLSSLAGWLIAPYLAWVTFAGWLNWRVVQLNKPFTGRAANASTSRERQDGGRVSS